MSLHKWESDPLFSAAEVVQDSADRMESVYRLLLHEQGLVHAEHPDSRLPTSVNYHRRDLATILETTKWQLEDFEKAVSLSAVMNKSQTTEDVIVRHTQFIGAIREQINQVEKSLEDSLVGKSIRSSEWVNLNKQDRDGLALFLSGRNPPQHVTHHDVEDSNILRRFLDPTTPSSSQDDGIIEHESREKDSMKMNGFAHVDQYYGSEKQSNLRKVGSHCSPGLGLDTQDSLQETSCRRHNEDHNWDLEANETKNKSFFHNNSLTGNYSGLNIFRYLNNLRSAYETRIARNYTKRLKDGEEERNSPSHIDVSHAGQGQHMRIGVQGFFFGFLANAMSFCLRLRGGRALCQRFHVPVNQQFVKLMLAAIFALAVLGILVRRIA